MTGGAQPIVAGKNTGFLTQVGPAALKDANNQSIVSFKNQPGIGAGNMVDSKMDEQGGSPATQAQKSKATLEELLAQYETRRIEYEKF